MKKYFFFKSLGSRLLGCIHIPKKNLHTFGVLIIHPFAEEKIISQRALLNLSKAFEEKGIPSFRFDFMGHGDSEGVFEESNITTRLLNIESAIKIFKHESGIRQVVLLGLRLGATLSLIASNENHDIQSVVLLSPIIDGKNYIDSCLRSNLTHQIAIYREIRTTRKGLIQELNSNKLVNIDGYLITKELYKEISAINLLNIAYNTLKNVLILEMSKGNTPIRKYVADLNEILVSHGVKTELRTANEDLIWKASQYYCSKIDNSINTIAEWLMKVYSS